MCLAINMMRIHLWKSRNDVEPQGSTTAPFRQSAAAFVFLPSEVNSFILLLFQNKRQRGVGAHFVGDPYF